ncbi:MAG: hypothetical protein Q7K39_03600 [Candidatus Magasanikbacteria bacterium]|nr:hypothetical protein [Candidatus Magasanikbacteria bacterium]
MMTYRFATQPETPTPPVRIYKWIALSFLVITVVLFVVIVFMLSKKVTVTVVAKEDIKSVAMTVKVQPKALLGAIGGTVTTTPFAWSEVFRPTGTKAQVGLATGQVILYNKTTAPQGLVKITRLLSPDGVLFHLSDKVTVPANGQVTANVYADKEGAASEIKPTTFTIPGLSPEKQKVIYAESKEPMKGGTTLVGMLTSEDVNSATKQYKDKATEAFWNSVSSTLPKDNKYVVTVSVKEVTINHKPGEEVSEFIISGTSTAAVVAYKESDLVAILEEAISQKVDVNSEKVISLDKNPKVTLAQFDALKGTADLSIKQNLVVTVNPDGEALAARNFMGKKKDEIERYIMGVDHVYAVDVKFSPSWISTAPSVPDRIKVIVKSVK